MLPGDVFQTLRRDLRPELLGFDNRPGDELGEKKQVEADIAYPFREAPAFREHRVAFASHLAARDIHDHAYAVEGVEGDPDGQGDTLHRFHPRRRKEGDHPDDKGGVLEDRKEREIQDNRETRPVFHPDLVTRHLVQDDPRRRDAVADTGDRQQNDEPRILPTVEDHARG
jgi:hypothetical protein